MDAKEGIPVSPGIAVARAFPLDSEEFTVTARPVAPEQIDAEVERFADAVKAAVAEVITLQQTTDMPDELRQLVDAHVMILKDPKIREEVEKTIRTEHSREPHPEHRSRLFSPWTVTPSGSFPRSRAT